MKVTVLLFLALVVVTLAPGPAQAVRRSRKRRDLPIIWQDIMNLPKDEIAASLKTIFDPNTRNGLDDRLREIAKNFLKDPAMDPLHFSVCPFEYEEEVAKINGTLDSVTATGISSLKIRKLHVNILLLKLTFDVSLPLLSVHGHYNMDGHIGGVLPLYGKGPFEFNLTDVRAAGAIKLGLRNRVVFIKNLDLDLSIGGLKVNIENLLEDEDISRVINQMINDLSPNMLTDNKQMIEEVTAHRIVHLLNSRLKGHTLKEISEFIMGAAEHVPTTTTMAELLGTTPIDQPATSTEAESPTTATVAPPTHASTTATVAPPSHASTTLAGKEEKTSLPTEADPFEL